MSEDLNIVPNLDEAEEGDESTKESKDIDINLTEGETNGKQGDDGAGKKPEPEDWSSFKYDIPQIRTGDTETDTIEASYVKQFIKDAKDKLGLTQANTKALLDYVAEVNKTTYQQRETERKELMDSFDKEIREDKVIGGKNLGKNIKIAREGLAWLTGGDKQDLKTLSELEILKVPAVIRMCYKVGLANSDGRIVTGGSVEPKINPLEVLYPSMKPEKRK